MRGLSSQVCVCTTQILVLDAWGLELPTSTVLLNGPGYLPTRLLTVIFKSTGAKRDALFSHGTFFPYACGCDLGFLQCCNEEQGERWVQLEASWDSADLRPVSRGISLTNQGHGRLSCKGDGHWHTAGEWEHGVAGGDGWVCTDRNTQSHCTGHLLTRKLSEVVTGRLSRESEQKELVGYFIQSREDHAEWPQCCLEFTVEGTRIFYLSLKFSLFFSPLDSAR